MTDTDLTLPASGVLELAPPAEQVDRVAYDGLRISQKLIVLLFLCVATVYLGWRYTTLNPAAPIFSWLIYGAELFGFFTTLLHVFMVWRLSVRRAPPAPSGLSVDVLVPTYNEPVDLVRRTLLAARNMDYPNTTWLLDDGRRPEMRALAEELGVRYLSRDDNRHAKAGNLNHALQHCSGEFVAIFDCDHAPKRNFLDETLGFFGDRKVAFVQTPQDFFNLDSYQHRRRGSGPVWTEQSLFFRVIQRGKDYWNAAFFCGSCAVVRRSALDRIGGFSTKSITEDLETSVELHKQGFSSVYVPQPLAFGLAPNAASPFLRQRIRWGQGAMQVIRQEWFFLRGRLSLAQRLNYMASTLTYFDGWQKGIFYLAPVWVLLTGTMPLIVPAELFLLLFIPYFVLTFAVFEELGRGFGRSTLIEQYNMARFAAFGWATLGLIRNNLRFKVTQKDGMTARQAEARAVSPQILIAALNLIAIAGGIVIWIIWRHLPFDGFVANLIWAGVNSLMAFLVVQFTLQRTRFRRREYRFPVPMPAQVCFAEHSAPMTLDDVSSSGCRLYGKFPESLQLGMRVDGRIFLPGLDLPFQAKVAALIPGGQGEQRFIKAIGLEFQWPDATTRDQLDLFLYGSDLQWQMHGLSERILTPTEAVSRWWRRRPKSNPDLETWCAAETMSAGVAQEPAIVSRAGADGRRIVATARRADGLGEINIREHSRMGSREHLVRPVRMLAQLSTPMGSLYLTEVQPC